MDKELRLLLLGLALILIFAGVVAQWPEREEPPYSGYGIVTFDITNYTILTSNSPGTN